MHRIVRQLIWTQLTSKVPFSLACRLSDLMTRWLMQVKNKSSSFIDWFKNIDNHLDFMTIYGKDISHSYLSQKGDYVMSVQKQIPLQRLLVKKWTKMEKINVIVLHGDVYDELQNITLDCSWSIVTQRQEEHHIVLITELKKRSMSCRLVLLFLHPPTVSFITICTRLNIVVLVTENTVAVERFCTQCDIIPALSLTDSNKSSQFSCTASVEICGGMPLLLLGNVLSLRNSRQLIVYAPTKCLVNEYTRLITSCLSMIKGWCQEAHDEINYVLPGGGAVSLYIVHTFLQDEIGKSSIAIHLLRTLLLAIPSSLRQDAHQFLLDNLRAKELYCNISQDSTVWCGYVERKPKVLLSPAMEDWEKEFVAHVTVPELSLESSILTMSLTTAVHPIGQLKGVLGTVLSVLRQLSRLDIQHTFIVQKT